MVVRAGHAIGLELEKRNKNLLKEHGIVIEENQIKVSQKTLEEANNWQEMDKRKIEKAFQQVREASPEAIKQHLKLDVKAYEDSKKTINISNDDVCAKGQKSKRVALTNEQKQERRKEQQRKGGRKNLKKSKYVYQNTTHFEFLNQQYHLVGSNLLAQLGDIIAFMLNNSGLDKNWVFYVDGQRTINECIKKRFWWKPIDMVLDWYHLNKRLSKQMYYSLKTCDQRDEVQRNLRDYLWYGLVDQAIDYIDQIDPALIKNQKELITLKGYFERNRPYIKCYALRKQLGLRLSSNRVEKTNDLLISERQKSKGISFTRPGSYGLAILTCLKLNKEEVEWMKNRQIPFKFAA